MGIISGCAMTAGSYMTKEEPITAQTAIDRYADMVYRLALSQMKNRTDADDLFQEVFVRLVSHVDTLESWEHVKAWLIRVTINCAKKHFDLYWNKNVDYIEDEERIRGEEAYEPPPEHPVREAVSKLPPKYRLAVHLYYYEELSIAEIAERTEQKEGTVKSSVPVFITCSCHHPPPVSVLPSGWTCPESLHKCQAPDESNTGYF